MAEHKAPPRPSLWYRHKFVIVNATLAGLLLLGITFSIFFSAKATTPNPGHPWTDIGNGFWQASNSQTALRTFTFPDTNATILTSSSSVILPERTINGNTTLSTSTDGVIFVNASTTPLTVTLPSATGTQSGYVYDIKKIDTSPVGIVTINTSNSQTIDNASSVTLSNPGESILLQSDGSNWRIIMRNDYDLNSFHMRGTSSTALTAWYTSYNVGASALLAASGGLTANKIYAMPLIITQNTTIDHIAVDVTTASGTMEMGIYNDSGQESPGSLLVDCGSVTSAVGIASSTTGLPLTVDSGLYWLVINPSNAMTVDGFPVADVISPLGYATPASTAINMGWSATQTKGALPATFPTTASTTITTTPLPAIFVHFSN